MCSQVWATELMAVLKSFHAICLSPIQSLEKIYTLIKLMANSNGKVPVKRYVPIICLRTADMYNYISGIRTTYSTCVLGLNNTEWLLSSQFTRGFTYQSRRGKQMLLFGTYVLQHGLTNFLSGLLGFRGHIRDGPRGRNFFKY